MPENTEKVRLTVIGTTFWEVTIFHGISTVRICICIANVNVLTVISLKNASLSLYLSHFLDLFFTSFSICSSVPKIFYYKDVSRCFKILLCDFFFLLDFAASRWRALYLRVFKHTKYIEKPLFFSLLENNRKSDAR